MRTTLVLGLACAACHSSPHAIDDGGIAADGAAVVDAAAPGDAYDPTRVWVHVNSRSGDGSPDPAAYVFFLDSTGALVADGMTDASGNASAELPTGGSVTVLSDTSGQSAAVHDEALTTFRSVKPGDFLHAGPSKDPTKLTGQTSLMYGQMPGDAQKGMPYFECGTAAPPGPPDGTDIFTFYDSCRTSTFAVLTLDSETGIDRYVWQPGVSYADHGSVAIADDFQPLGTATTTIQNFPANATGGAWMYTMVGALRLQMDLHSLTPLSAPGNEVMPLRYPPNAGPTVLYVTEVIGTAPLQGHTYVTTGSADRITVDANELPLPTIANKPMQNPTGVTWIQTGGGAPDARFVSWSGHWNDAQTGIQHTASWLVIEDPNAVSYTTLPGLPPVFESEDPTTAPNVVLDGAGVEYVDYDNLSGFDQARGYGAGLADISAALLDVDHHAHFTQSP